MNELFIMILVVLVILIFIVVLTKKTVEKKNLKNKSTKNKNVLELNKYNEKSEIPTNSTSRKMRVVDMLVYISDVEEHVFEVYPVLKDMNTNEIYVSFKDHGYGKYFYQYHKNTKNIEVKTSAGRVIEKNDWATLYIVKKLGKVLVNKNKIMINGKEYEYVGKMNSKNKIPLQKNKIYNIIDKDFLELINHSNFYDGFIKFDK